MENDGCKKEKLPDLVNESQGGGGLRAYESGSKVRIPMI